MRPLAHLGLLALVLLALSAGCDNDPAEASVVNEIPGATLEKAWFRTTLFEGPLETGQTSPTLRVGIGTEPAYAIVRINGHAFVARTNDAVDAAEADRTRIVFSAAAARSVCFGEPRLSDEELDFVSSRIFPGEEVSTDSAQCFAP